MGKRQSKRDKERTNDDDEETDSMYTISDHQHDRVGDNTTHAWEGDRGTHVQNSTSSQWNLSHRRGASGHMRSRRRKHSRRYSHEWTGLRDLAVWTVASSRA